MDLLASDRTRINRGEWPFFGEGKDTFGGRPCPARALQFVLQQFTHQRVNGRVMLGSIDLRLADQVGGKTERNIPRFHILESITQSCVPQGILALFWFIHFSSLTSVSSHAILKDD